MQVKSGRVVVGPTTTDQCGHIPVNIVIVFLLERANTVLYMYMCTLAIDACIHTQSSTYNFAMITLFCAKCVVTFVYVSAQE